MSIDTRLKGAARSLPMLRRSERGAVRAPETGADRDPALSGDAPLAPLPHAPRVAGRRNPRWIALGVVALCLGGLLSYLIYAQVAAESTVVAMARTVDRGAVI